MQGANVIATRAVSAELQEQFAALSGDRNPMHMDAVAARRTQAGLPVVHGIHTLLWALESLAECGLLVSPVARVRVRFLKWVYVGDEAELTLPGGLVADPRTLAVSVQGLEALAADVTYGERAAAGGAGSVSPAAARTAAADLSIEEAEGLSGEAYVAPAEDAAAMFPALAKLIGGTGIAEIAACSYIVGMEAPGLHSMFSKADLKILDSGAAAVERQALHWDVSYTDPRFRKARIAVRGEAVSGTLEVFFRVPPVEQAGMELLAKHIRADEFSGMRALIVGGFQHGAGRPGCCSTMRGLDRRSRSRDWIRLRHICFTSRRARSTGPSKVCFREPSWRSLCSFTCRGSTICAWR
jgi:hypothetical protein